MKQPTRSTLLLVTSSRIARADFDGALWECKTAPRPASDAVGTALALGGKAGAVWVLSENVFEHRVVLNAAQVTGLTPEQLERALSFEVEPFSGIAVAESVTGFYRNAEGVFDVIELTLAARDSIVRAVTEAGGRLAGIAHPGSVPDEAALETWFVQMLPRLQSGELPIITAPAPELSANLFRVTAAGLAAAAIVLLLIFGSWTALQRRGLEKRAAELTAASRELDTVNKQNIELRKQLVAFENERAQRERVMARRGALLALLTGLATSRPEDVVVRGIKADGPSSLVVSGLSLEADAVDEMSIVLTQSLRAAGWNAQPRSKTGKRNLTNGGPWEFSLTLTHEETAGEKTIHLSQREAR